MGTSQIQYISVHIIAQFVISGNNILLFSLDKVVAEMLKYCKPNIAVTGKSSSANPSENPGRWLEVRVVSALGKCARERR